MAKYSCPACRRQTALTRDGFCQKCSPVVVNKVAILRARRIEQRALDKWLVSARNTARLAREAEEADLWALQALSDLPA